MTPVFHRSGFPAPMTRFILFLLLLSPARAQNVLDVWSITTLAASTATPLVTVTGADGTVCVLTNQASTTIYFTWRCTSADAKAITRTAQFSTTSTAQTNLVLSSGQSAVGPLCLVVENPTAAAITAGSLGSVPAGGVAWNCTASGTSVVAGTAVWP